MRAEWSLSGKEAVLRARQSIEMSDVYHAYIIDWRLPDMNGIEVTRQIRSLHDDTPIIILTAYDWSDIEVEAKAAGVTAFCSKPMFMSDLRETLMSALGQKLTDASQELLPEENADFKDRHILLVEDNELNREIAQEILREYGFRVDTAENGAVAVEKVRTAAPGSYDLVLMDVQMPVMDGYTATRQIRALEDPALAGIPILAMTANAFDEDRRNAMESGMNGFLSKPIVIGDLVQELHKILCPNRLSGIKNKAPAAIRIRRSRTSAKFAAGAFVFVGWCYDFSTSARTCSRCGISSGFAMWPFIPAFKAFRRSSSKSFAVMAKMGMSAFAASGRARICRVAS